MTRRAGAVNTLIRTATGWEGDNTDGAGGAAHGVAPALLDAGVADLYIVNRNGAHADALADALGEPGRVHPRYLSDVGTLGVFDLVINATSAARGGTPLDLPGGLFAPRGDAVDLSYGEAAIGFLSWARASGADKAIDGLGMLVEQAAESFQRWHGVRPETDPVYAMLRAHDDVLVTAD